MSTETDRHPFLYLAMILAMALWGLSWTNGKLLGAYGLTAAVLMFWRFLISAVAMLIFLLSRGQSIKLDQRSIILVVAGGVLIALYNVFYFSGTRIGAAGAGGVLVTTLNPVVTFLLVAIFTGTRPGLKQHLGILLGFIGGALILKFWQLGWDGLLQSGNIYFLLCAVSWAFLTLVSTRSRVSMPSLVFSFWVYTVATLLSVLMSPPSELLVVFSLDAAFWLNMTSISLGAMTFATTIYFLATTGLGSARASAFIFTVPLSAMLFSMLILNEKLHLFTAIGGTLSIIAVYLVNQPGRTDKTGGS